MKLNSLLIALLLFNLGLSAQPAGPHPGTSSGIHHTSEPATNSQSSNHLGSTTNGGTIRAHGDIRISTEGPIDLLMSRYYYMNSSNPAISVFRIQMANSTNRQVVYEAKSKFLQNFRDLRADVDFQQPYYKLRTGYFKERYEAYRMLKEIKEEFPQAYLVHEEVNITKLMQQGNW